DLPIGILPVAETRAMRTSFASQIPTSFPPTTREETPSGTLFSMNTDLIISWHAMAVNGVFSDGFHIHTSPHTQASMAFQDQTATGKLNAEIIPTTPSGCHCSYIRC